VSIAMLFTLTLLLSPSMAHLIANEEHIERKEGIHHFFRNHQAIFKVYFFTFLGVFVGFLILGLVGEYYTTFEYQIKFLENQQGLTTKLIEDFLQQGYTPSVENLAGLFSENIKVLLITFVLAIFYGAGAILVEKFGTSGFSNILQDCCLLLAVAASFILVGSILEVFVSSQLMRIVLG